MRIATLQTNAGPKAAVQLEHEYAVLPFTVRKLLEAGPAGVEAAEQAVARPGTQKVPVKDAQFLPVVPDPNKIICLGLNYRDHAAESGQAIPKDPILFSKYATALLGHQGDIVIPSISEKVDYEAELVVVIGKRGKNIKEDEALTYVAGYTIGNDVSARDWQLEKDGGQWMAGKTFDTFAPCGPNLVTSDEIEDPYSMKITLKLNREVMQEGNTSEMIFGIPRVVSHLSNILTLEPGDLIFTGTPPGVGMSRDPQRFLRKDDVVDVEIEGLGMLRSQVLQG